MLNMTFVYTFERISLLMFIKCVVYTYTNLRTHTYTANVCIDLNSLVFFAVFLFVVVFSLFCMHLYILVV